MSPKNSDKNKTGKIICVFVHGWAMNGAVWESCFEFLPDWMDVIQVDLPGHGTMADINAEDINGYVQALAALVNRPAIWVGWSLGGLAVLQLAKDYPEQVAGLFMVATNPCFVQKENWSCAVDKQVFDQFADVLKKDTDATIKRFLALQVKGSGLTMSTVRELQQSIQQRGRASLDALKLGLDILATTDLRNELPYLNCPMNWLLGGRDTLVPVELSDALKTLQPNINTIVEPEAAHAPFISHTEKFTHALIDFAESLR
ncbi:MAG: pimeloyl-ACP methyl ester esterase BioH [Gammaproteobacteria bacterium]|nr:pimeloyl-ACP methyl ester esterase BioH [Gammaproteobacteria bacterium]